MNEVYLELGGNEGDRLFNLQRAVNEISENIGTIDKQSSVYETPPWGFESEQWFYNQIVCVKTSCEALVVLEELLKIEKKLGRIRGNQQYCSRTIDIDILFFNVAVFNLPDLIVPHPRLHLRKFVLVPMCEIAPDFIHPVIGKTMTTLLQQCTDLSLIKKI